MAKNKRRSKPRPKMTDDIRFIVYARANYRCERCLEITASINLHHRLPRQMGGTRIESIHAPANLILLCGSGTSGCHGWVESNRDEARKLGFLLYRIDSAEEIPFRDISNKWWLVDNLGQKTQFDTKGELSDG